MKTPNPASGRISNHANGVGTVSPEMVNRRAQELAVINARDDEKFTEADWLQAKRELVGQENSGDQQSEEPIAGLTKWDERPDSEHRAPNSPSTDDEETVAEQLTREGREEANHDLMLNASRGTKEE